MSQNEKLLVGWSGASITPDCPIMLCGQMYSRVSAYVHDPITATALAIDDGTDHVIMVSCDMAGIDVNLSARLRAKVNGYHGINGEKVTVSATHTHTSSYFGVDLFCAFSEIIGADKVPSIDIPDNILDGEEASLYWLDIVSKIICQAWDSRKEGGISIVQDYAAVAFNRRPVFQNPDGSQTSVMYGACSQDNFIRFEGPADHSLQTLFTFNQEGEVTGVVVDVPCPAQIMELHYFISADYWHPARALIRQKLDKNIWVLPICGAAGDQNPIDLVRFSKTNEKELRAWNAQAGEVWCNYDLGGECEAAGQRISDAVLRAYRKARNTIRYQLPLKHQVVTMSLPIRKVSEEDYQEAKADIMQYTKDFNADRRMKFSDVVRMFEPVGVVDRYNLQNKNDMFDFRMNIFRIGDAVFCSNPFELFVDYSFRIQARCKARNVFVMQLTNSEGGYLPTVAAVNGGSYSSKPASTTLGPEGGDELVEVTIKTINGLFEE